MEKKLKYGQQVLVLLLLFIGLTLVGSLLTALLMDMLGKGSTGLLISQGISQLFIFVVPIILMVLIYRWDVKDWFQLNFKGEKWGKSGVAIIILILLLPFVDMLTQWNDGWHLSEKYAELEALLRMDALAEVMETMLQADNIGKLLFNVFIIALVPAVCEELFFRCGIQQLLTKWFKNGHLAILVTAIVFSLMHGEVFAFIPRFVLGLLLGYLFYYSGSVLVNATTHFINNAMVVVWYYLYQHETLALAPEESLNIPTLWVVLCAVAGIALFYITFVMKDKQQKIG